ncbi:MAG: hypothetical protein VB140_02090 [Burkholderia sp.]
MRVNVNGFRSIYATTPNFLCSLIQDHIFLSIDSRSADRLVLQSSPAPFRV